MVLATAVVDRAEGDRQSCPAMTADPPAPPENSEFWLDYLTNGSPSERRSRRLFKRIPHDPRCKICLAPFGGFGAPLMRMIGKRPSPQSPQMCGSCYSFLAEHHGGAEIEVSLLFADVRGSTALAEKMTAGQFRDLMNRFYSTATKVVFDHDGGVDKFVGDELVANFYPLLTGERHAERAVEAAVALLKATGHEDADGPWIPVGAGVHTGPVWLGSVGEGARTELTVLGDNVNIAARLATEARAGEVLVTSEAAAAANLKAGLERRRLELKGKQELIEVVSLSVGPAR
jgi:adenylate cyclase